MANKLILKTIVEVQQDVGGSLGAEQGITYTNYQLDGNANRRRWGGKYQTWANPYDDEAVAYYKNVVAVDSGGAKPLSDNTFCEENAVTDGTKPATVYLLAVEYVSELGTVGNVAVKVSGEIFASLDLGESIVIPMHYGETLGDIYIMPGAYSDDVNEATINVLLVGVS